MRICFLLLIALSLAACALTDTSSPLPDRPTPPPTSQPPAVLPDAEDVLEPSPQLLDPSHGASQTIQEGVKLAWRWGRSLQPGELFEVRIAKRGRAYERATLAQSTVFDATDWLLARGAGEYQWSVRVIQHRPENNMERRISLEAEPFDLEITGEESASLPPAEIPVAETIIDIPAGLEARLYAQTHVTANTVITFGPDERMYVLNLTGEIRRLTDADSDHFAERVDVLYADAEDSLIHAVGMAIREDGTIFVSDSGRISTITDSDDDDLLDTITPVVEGLPSLLYPFHSNNGIAFGPDGKLYVGVGSTTDHGPDLHQPYEASILRVNDDGSDLEVFATGFRNVYDLAFSPDGDLFAGDNGPDILDHSLRYLPPEEINHVREGLDYGFPRAFGKLLPVGERSEPALVELFPSVVTGGMAFYDKTLLPAAYHNGLFVVQHGSSITSALDRSDVHGYSVIFVWLTRNDDGTYTGDREPFIQFDRFRNPPALPLDVAVGPDGALYISEWQDGEIYRITPAGD